MKLDLRRSQPRALVSYVNIKATVSYVKATSFLYLDERGLNKYARDTFSPIDELTYVFQKQLSDIAGMSEALRYAISKPLDDEATVDDLLSLAIGYVRDFGEIQEVNDSPALSFGKNPTDVLNSSDQITGKDVTKDIFENVYMQDLADVNNGDGLEYSFGKGTTDSIDTPSDSAATNTGKNLGDSVESSEELTAFVIGKVLDDVASIAEQLSQVVDKGTFTDDVTTSDDLVRYVDYVRDHSDSASTSDDQTLDIGKNPTDSVESLDAFEKVLGKIVADAVTNSDLAELSFDKPISDAATPSDEESHIVAFERQFADVASGLDVHTFLVSKTLSDSATASETGRLVSTDYWADYCSEDYVGTGRTF